MLHCWADKATVMADKYGWDSAEWAEAFNENGTCMLEKDHSGPHEFTPDSEVTVSFK
jgi:hypothetical protein